MANLLQSSQNKQTSAPGYYTDYLTNLATQGKTAADQAQFVGAQPLQEKAFSEVCQNFGNQQASIAAGKGLVGQAANQNVTGAAAPYLQAGTGASPLNAMAPYAETAMGTTGYEAGVPFVTQGATKSGLCAANPYLQQATGTSPADLAASYMNPFLKTAVQSMSDIAQRNIRQNLSPAAAAAAVGSGQFGSQRGAQVQGQITAQANQDLNNQIAQMMASGYGQALCAAGKQNALVANAGNTAGALTNQTAQNQINAGTNLGNLQQGANQIAAGLGSTAAQAQAQQNQANLTAAQTAATAAANQGQLLNTAGTTMGNLAQTGANMNLACINALSTLGGQQQTIGQNEQNYPLTKLQSLGSLLQGYSIPTGTRTTLCMSPLSGAAALGAAGKAAITCFPGIKSGLDNIIKGGVSIGGGGGGSSDGNSSDCDINGLCLPCCAGDLPEELGDCYSYCCCCCCICLEADGGLIKSKARGFKGCASTYSRGALPSKKG